MLINHEWTKDRPNILAPDILAKLRDALEQGIIFGEHRHYYGGCSLDCWAAADFDQFMGYIGQSKPGDHYIVWSLSELLEKNLDLAVLKGQQQAQGVETELPHEDLATVQNYLATKYNEIITVFHNPAQGKVESEIYDVDYYDSFLETAETYFAAGGVIYVLPLTAIDKPTYIFVDGKYPNANGEVPVGGAY